MDCVMRLTKSLARAVRQVGTPGARARRRRGVGCGRSTASHLPAEILEHRALLSGVSIVSDVAVDLLADPTVHAWSPGSIAWPGPTETRLVTAGETGGFPSPSPVDPKEASPADSTLAKDVLSEGDAIPEGGSEVVADASETSPDVPSPGWSDEWTDTPPLLIGDDRIDSNSIGLAQSEPSPDANSEFHDAGSGVLSSERNFFEPRPSLDDTANPLSSDQVDSDQPAKAEDNSLRSSGLPDVGTGGQLDLPEVLSQDGLNNSSLGSGREDIDSVVRTAETNHDVRHAAAGHSHADAWQRVTPPFTDSRILIAGSTQARDTAPNQHRPWTSQHESTTAADSELARTSSDGHSLRAVHRSSGLSVPKPRASGPRSSLSFAPGAGVILRAVLGGANSAARAGTPAEAGPADDSQRLLAVVLQSSRLEPVASTNPVSWRISFQTGKSPSLNDRHAQHRGQSLLRAAGWEPDDFEADPLIPEPAGPDAVLVALRYQQHPRAPPASDLSGLRMTFTARNAAGMLSRLRYSIAPRGPSLETSDLASLACPFLSGPGVIGKNRTSGRVMTTVVALSA
jgi:hypothetical protein